MKKIFILAAVCVLVTTFTLPAMGQPPEGKKKDRTPHELGLFTPWGTEWKIGGQIYWHAFWVKRDTRMKFTPGPGGGWGDVGSDEDLSYGLNYLNTFMNVELKRENIKGFFQTNYDKADEKLVMRMAYGEWNFGKGYFIIGKANTPTRRGQLGTAIDRGYGPPGGYGASAGTLRQLQMQLRFPIPIGQIQVAGIQPEYTPSGTPPGTGSPNDDVNPALNDGDIEYPQLEAALELKFGPTRFHLSGAVYEFKEVDEAVGQSTREYKLESNLIKLGARLDLGPFEIRGQIWDSKNPRQLGVASGSSLRMNAQFHSAIDGYADVDATGMGVRAYYTFNKKFGVTAGYTTETAERDDPINLHQESEADEIFLKIPIQVYKHVIIAPTFGQTRIYTTINNVKEKTEDNKYYGCMFQIVF